MACLSLNKMKYGLFIGVKLSQDLQIGTIWRLALCFFVAVDLLFQVMQILQWLPVKFMQKSQLRLKPHIRNQGFHCMEYVHFVNSSECFYHEI